MTKKEMQEKKAKWQLLLSEEVLDLQFEDKEEFVKAVDFAIDHILQAASFDVPMNEVTIEGWREIARSLRVFADGIEDGIKECEEE